MTPLTLMILTHACVSAAPYPHRGAPAVEIAVDDLVALGAVERTDPTNMLRATPMGQAWLNLICRTPAPTQAWVDGEGRVIE